MAKINLNLLEKIHSRVFGDNMFYVGVKLDIGKMFFICSAFLYFLVYLFVLGGFYINITSEILFFLFPVFVFSTFALLYEVIVFFITIYTEEWLIIKYFFLAILLMLYIFILAIHLGLKIIS